MLHRICTIATYEIIHIIRDAKLRIIISIIGLFFAFIFGASYSMKTIEEMPLAVCNEDHSQISREIVQAFDASDKFRVVCTAANYGEIKNLIDHDQVKVGLIIPRDFQKQVLRGNPVEILTVFDSSNLIYAYTIKRTAQLLTLTLSAEVGVKMLAAGGVLTDQAMGIVNAVDFRMEPWYNPTTNYVNYLYLGLLLLIVHQVTVVCAGISFTRERENGNWLQFALAPINKAEVLIGKALPYFLMGIFNCCLLLFLANLMLDLPLHGNYALFLLFIITMFAGIVPLGFCISLVCSNSLQPTRFVIASSLPLFLASGFTWPLESMPAVIRWIMYCQPLTWMLKAARAITMRNAGWDIVAPYLLILVAMAIIFWLSAYLLFKHAIAPGKQRITQQHLQSIPASTEQL